MHAAAAGRAAPVRHYTFVQPPDYYRSLPEAYPKKPVIF
jgi:hypothetical protein